MVTHIIISDYPLNYMIETNNVHNLILICARFTIMMLIENENMFVAFSSLRLQPAIKVEHS